MKAAGQHGDITIELAILLPSLLLLVNLAMDVGRISLARAAIDSATYSAARAASLARDPGTAQSRAQHSVETTLAAQDLHCLELLVDVDTAQFARDAGEPASVTVTVECRVDLADYALPGTPTSHWVGAQYSSLRCTPPRVPAVRGARRAAGSPPRRGQG